MAERSAPPADQIPLALERYAEGLRLLREGAQVATGQTPRATIWSRNKARLYRYTPVVRQPRPIPLLLVYALINRAYILDLLPGNSFVEYLVGRGFDVYLLDWGIPGDEDQGLGLANYVLDYLPAAVRRVLRTAGADQLSLLGYCMGGTLGAMYAALFPEGPLRNLVLLTAPIDFTPESSGLYGLWTSARHFDPDRLVEALGNVPADLIDAGNRLLKPVANSIGPYVALWDAVLRDQSLNTWLAMNQWVNDGIPFPGAAFREWIRDLYQQNKLARGALTLDGRPVDLARITCSVLAVAATRDHICLPAQAEAIMRLVASEDKELALLDTGHLGVMVGSLASAHLWPRVSGWLESRSQADG